MDDTIAEEYEICELENDIMILKKKKRTKKRKIVKEPQEESASIYSIT